MNLLDRAVMAVAPASGLRRIRARRAASILANYDAATGGRRSRSWRPTGTDADAASRRRARLAFVSRDMIRNTPLAGRGRDVIVNNTVGDGIIPSVDAPSEATKARFLDLVISHLDTTDIDANGLLNLYGLQRLALSTVVESGEWLVRLRRRRLSDGLSLPFQVQVLEPDYLDSSRDSMTTSGGARVFEGIEYDAIGRRVAYWLHDDHPGSAHGWRLPRSRRVPASEVIHLFRQDRPGQMRGVSWYAPVALTLQDLRDYFDAQLMKQKIGACFAAFRVEPDAVSDDVDSTMPTSRAPGAIFKLGPGEDVRFASPPKMDDNSFVRDCVREVAMGLGITYESFFGDLSQVNYSSARMGRLEMDRNISSWQWLMLVPQMCDRIADWMLEAWNVLEPMRDLRRARITWTPPARIIVDPAREIPAMREKVRAGFASWQAEVRSLGYDPETVAAEMAEDNIRFDTLGITVTSDARQDTQPRSTRPEDADGE